MLSFLIVLYALCGVQGKAFPSRYKRNYEASYHYIPFEEGIVQLPAGYSPENLPNYHDYIHGYIQTNEHDWSSYYNKPVPSKPISNVNGHHKMKEKHTWHFIDQNYVPINQFVDEGHPFESEVEAPNVIEALVKKEVIDIHGTEYDAPVVVEALIRKGNMDHVDAEIPVVIDSLTIEDDPINYEYDRNSVLTDSSIKHRDVDEYKFKVSNLDLLTDKQKPSASYELYESVKIDPVMTHDALEFPVKVDSLTKKKEQAASYDMYEPTKEKPLKNVQLIPSNELELPVIVDSLGEKDEPIKVESATSYYLHEPVKEKPVKEKPIKEKPVVAYDASDYLIGLNSLNEVDHDHETSVISLTIEEDPINYEYDKNPVLTDSSIKHQDVDKYKFKVSNLDLLTDKQKASAQYELYESVKSEAVVTHDALEFPVKVDSLTKKKEQAASYDIHQPIKNFQFIPSNELELPVIVDSLSKKDKPIKVESATSYLHEPVKEKPVVAYDAFDYPFGFNSLNEVDHDHETPVIIEALIKKEKPALHMEEEYEMPVVVEALTRKHPVYENEEANTKENKILAKEKERNLFYPGKAILTKEDIKNFDIPVIEALAFEQDIESIEIPKQEYIALDEIHGSIEPEMDSFDETGDLGSAMDFDRSGFSRSFLPVNSDIFSMVKNIKEQERRKFKSCVTPKNETGNCMSFQLCSVSTSVSNIEELLRNVCIIDEVFLGVCCPEFPVETVRVDWEQLKPDTEMLSEEKTSHISEECGRLPSMITDLDPWPWMALLIARSSAKIFCGGALIAEQYVLTAAHCTKRIPRNQILVRLALPTSESSAEPDFEVIEIKRHAGYNPRTMQNDIALLKLSRRVHFGDFRRVVCLAKDEEGIEGLVSKSASLLRWKETLGEIKDVETLSVISNQECQNRMRTAIADSILCTEPRTDETMCNVDSGAPLIIAKNDKFEVIGILTWNRNDCDERFPTVFTRVSNYHRWIEKLAS